MKIKHSLVALGIFSLFICACEEEEVKTFWALDEPNMRFYEVEAALRAEGDHCKFWVEKTLKVTEADLVDLVAEYDSKIRPKMLDVFSVQGPIKEPGTDKVVAQNSLEWADHLGDGDGKLSILILDIPGGDDRSYIAGYFMPHNFYAKSDSREEHYQTSNEADMVYMNSKLISNVSEFGTTLAHETQHLMNFVNSALLRRYYDKDWGMEDWDSMDTWINEGLSAAAEYVYSGKHSEERIWWYNNQNRADVEGQIPFGNNFFVWGELPKYILDEYSTVYLFFQWLRLQAGGSPDIYQRISSSTTSNHQAVVSAIQGRGNYGDEANLAWETLLRDWLVANVFASEKAPSPRHGYMGDSLLSNLRPWVLPSGETSIQLLPGEGVFSFTSAPDKTYGADPKYGQNIRYAGLDASGDGSVKDGTSYTFGLLLSYNVNTVNKPGQGQSYGTLLEVAEISPDKIPSSASHVSKNLKNFVRNVSGQPPPKPQAISIWDMLRLRSSQTDAPSFLTIREK